MFFMIFFLQEQRDRDTRFTRASILMVLAFGLCHTPRLISNILEMFYGYETPWVSNIQYMNFIDNSKLGEPLDIVENNIEILKLDFCMHFFNSSVEPFLEDSNMF